MKNSKQIYVSLFLLIGFLLSLTCSLVSSYQDDVLLTKASKAIHYTTKTTSSNSENLIYEETENDNKDSTESLFVYLPHFLCPQLVDNSSSPTNSSFSYIEHTTNSIFLSIRVLRI